MMVAKFIIMLGMNMSAYHSFPITVNAYYTKNKDGDETDHKQNTGIMKKSKLQK